MTEVAVTRTVARLPNSFFFFFRIFVVSKNLMTMAERIEDDKIENDKERQTEEMAVDGVCKEGEAMSEGCYKSSGKGRRRCSREPAS